MRIILIKLDSNNKVITQWEQEHDQAHPETGLMDVTNHPDGPKFMGRQLSDGSFTPYSEPPKSRREELKGILEARSWTQEERDEVLAFQL